MRFNREIFRNRSVPFAIVTAVALAALAAYVPAHAQPQPSVVHWVALGPSGPNIGSGKVNAFAYVQSNPNVMYFGGGWGNTPRESPSQSGIYGTTDGGQHWTALNNGLTNPDGTISSVINGLWLDQAHPSVVLAATEFGGTFRSTDGGTSWVNVDRSESTQFTQNGSTIYVASRRGVLASTDDGATWTVSLSSTAGASTVNSANGATYAGTMSGDVYRLNGSTWSKVGHPGFGPVHNVAVDPFNARIVYANVDDRYAWNQNLYGSIDGGVTWKQIYCNCSIGAQAIAFSLVVPDRIYLGDDGGGFIYYFTADGNQNPSLSYGAQPYGVDMRYIIPAPGPSQTDDACYLLMDQGVFYASHCTSGVAPGINPNVSDTLAYDVKVTSSGANIIAPLQDNSAASSFDGGKNWNYAGSAAYAGEGGEAFIDPKNLSHCYFAHPDVGLFVSFDSCASFAQRVNSGAASVTFDPAHAGKVYAIEGADTPSSQIIVSSDGGTTWTAAPWHFTDPYQVAISPTDAKTVVVATGTNFTSKLYYSHDGGTTFHATAGLPLGVAPQQQTIYFPTHRFFVAFPLTGTPGMVLLSDHDPGTNNVLIYRSTDSAQTFTLVKTFVQPKPPRLWPHLLFPTSHEKPIPKAPYYATRFYGNRLAFNPQPPTGHTPAVVLTTRFGAFASFDGGSTWSRIDKTAVPHQFEGLAWSGGYVYLATYGQGVIRTATPLQ